MKNLILSGIFSLMASFIMSCREQGDTTIKTPIVLFENGDFPVSNQEIIETAIINYFDQFDRLNEVIDTVKVMDYNGKDSSNFTESVNPDDSTDISLVKAEYATFVVIPLGYQTTNVNIHKPDLEQAIYKQSFGLFSPKEMTPCRGYTFKDGSILIGFQGLSLVLKMPDGTEKKFTEVEEASARVCALKVDDEDDSVYFSPRASLMKEKINKGALSEDDLVSFQMNSDFVGFVAKWLKIDRNSVTLMDIEMIKKEFE